MPSPPSAFPLRPLAVMFVLQTALTMGAFAFPVIIPVAAPDIGIAPESVGFLVAAVYIVGMAMGLGAGALEARFGATRVFQALLAFGAAGAATLAAGAAAIMAFLAAMLIGCATGPMNPTGSAVLSRVTTPSNRALVFSLKQCATPAGGMLAGALLPVLIEAADWRYAMLALAAATAVLVLAAPFGRLGAARPDAQTGAAPIKDLRTTFADPSVRAVSGAGFALAICQMGLVTYLVVFLWREAGYTPTEAGLIFSALHLSGIGARVALGFVADRLIPTRRLLCLLAVLLAMALVAITQLDAGWPRLAVLGVVAAAGASGNGWVGLFFAELARLAPEDRVAAVAGGGQFVTYIGLVSGPVLFGALLEATGDFALCFSALAVVAILSALQLARSTPSDTPAA